MLRLRALLHLEDVEEIPLIVHELHEATRRFVPQGGLQREEEEKAGVADEGDHPGFLALRLSIAEAAGQKLGLDADVDLFYPSY